MKKIIICLTILSVSAVLYAQIPIKLKVEGVEKNAGKIIVSIFNSESTYKTREGYLYLILNPSNEIVNKDINLPMGHYAISIYQDSNGNGKLDTNIIGIPKEKFGFTNYDGKSAPGGFNRHKVQVNEKVNEVVVRLYKI